MMELLVHFQCDTSKKNTSPEIERPGGARRAEVTSEEETPNQGATFDTTANNASLASERLWLDLQVAIPCVGFTPSGEWSDDGHRSIQNTVRYTECSPNRFKELWKD
jgi:hypothetical protein